MIYPSSYSKQLLISTISFLVILVAALMYMIYQLSYTPKLSGEFCIICCAFVIVSATIIHSFCHQIRSVEFRDNMLILHTLCGAKNISINHITEINHKTPIAKDIRLFAIGGLFGYIGIFRGNDCGKYKAYVNNSTNAFYVKTKDGKCYVASCDNSETLIAAIKEYIH